MNKVYIGRIFYRDGGERITTDNSHMIDWIKTNTQWHEFKLPEIKTLRRYDVYLGVTLYEDDATAFLLRFG